MKQIGITEFRDKMKETVNKMKPGERIKIISRSREIGTFIKTKGENK